MRRAIQPRSFILGQRVLTGARCLLTSLLLVFCLASQAYAQFPNAPENVAATDGTSLTSVTVTWEAPSSGPIVTGYSVYRSQNNELCTGAPIATVGAGTLSHQDLTVVANTIYYYSVRATGTSGPGNCSDTDSGYAGVLPPPNRPVGVNATTTLLDKIQVSWSAPGSSQPIDEYLVFRSTTSEFCAGTPIATVPFGTNLYDDTSATPGQVYYYTAKSSGPTGLSNCSDEIALGFRVQAPPPLPPTNVQASDGTFEDRILVTWVLPTGSQPIDTFTIYRSETSQLCADELQSGILGTETSFEDSASPVPGRLYYYSMRSFGPTGASNCSPIDPGYARVGVPTSISASDGTYEDKVVVSWAPPLMGGDIVGYTLFRDTSSTQCQVLRSATIQSSAVMFEDTTAQPGIRYYYSMLTRSQNGSSFCSAVDPGFARVSAPQDVAATDGEHENKIVVTWSAPNGNPPLTSYKVYRSLQSAQCQDLVAENIDPQDRTFEDMNVNSGVPYYYSVRGVGATGETSCSPVDVGFARTALPVCNNGIDDDGDNLIDLADPGCLGNPNNFTEQDPPAPPLCSNGKDDDFDGLVDLDDPGCLGDSNRNTEKNPSGPTCDNGVDDDGDGAIDFRIDGKGDTDCTSVDDLSESTSDSELKSPAYSKFNTYLGQNNFAELVNQGSSDEVVEVTVINLRGQEMITRSYLVPSQSEVDVDVNGLVQFACDVLRSNCEGFEDLSASGAQNGSGVPDGVVDTYGLVKFVFDTSGPGDRLLGRMSFYRRNVDGNYSFAFAREFVNPSNGSSYATGNTYDPQGYGFLVPNWAEVINLASSEKSFLMKIFDQSGVQKFRKRFTLPAFGEIDIAAGHEFLTAEGTVDEGVYLVEVIPDDSSADYFLSVSRYSSDASPGVDPATYRFAFTLPGVSGVRGPIYAPIGNQINGATGMNPATQLTNWVEIANVDTRELAVEIVYRSESGGQLGRTTALIAPKAQLHFNAGAFFGAAGNGAVEVEADGRVLMQSLSYVHGSDNLLQTAFASVSRAPGRQVQAGTINTFIGMQNLLQVFATSSAEVRSAVSIRSFDGQDFALTLGVNALGASSLSLSNSSQVSIGADTYGALQLDNGIDGVVAGEVRRVRVREDGVVDFVMPTAIQ